MLSNVDDCFYSSRILQEKASGIPSCVSQISHIKRVIYLDSCLNHIHVLDFRSRRVLYVREIKSN